MDPPLDDQELQAWSVTARLAAVPHIVIEQLPEEVRLLIQEAKDIHPQMAAGAAAREAPTINAVAPAR
ncbi:hypothetical protein NU688_32965 [Variovorax sp. ZS18.2.2]|uniref:hypothetical protein n=1 Tax=Variovorax sp. ZS18.2.2 TaxID=2971255 RepID=UPI002150F162|nr:hypothetical protein [Variovorax sp. ZS18.2.2]MCR6481009.1 hypothetical protein [Variovorax sp. ZS18.2.2]